MSGCVPRAAPPALDPGKAGPLRLVPRLARQQRQLLHQGLMRRARLRALKHDDLWA
jgi:hypothetical protein